MSSGLWCTGSASRTAAVLRVGGIEEPRRERVEQDRVAVRSDPDLSGELRHGLPLPRPRRCAPSIPSDRRADRTVPSRRRGGRRADRCHNAAMAPVDPALLAEAVDLLQQAGRLTLDWFRDTGLAIERKGDGTPVTAADKAAERFLREEIARRHPDDTIVGEEEATRVGTSGRTWTIDPIDGTKAFTHGVALYCNLLAIDDDEGAGRRRHQHAGARRDRLGRSRPRLLLQRRAVPGQRPRPHREGPHLVVDLRELDRRPAPAAAGAAPQPPHVGRRLRVRPRGLGPHRGHGRPAGRHLGRGPDAGDPHRGRRPLLRVGRVTDPARGSGIASNGIIHDELLALLNG